MKNILVIKLRYIGDILLATPVLRALRDRFPEARLTMAVNRGTEEILKRNPDIDDVVVVNRGALLRQIRFLRELRRRRFDCVIDLTDGDRAAILARVTGAPVRVGFNEEHRWRGLLYTSLATPGRLVHRVERDLQAVRVLGIEPKTSTPVLRTSEEDEGGAGGILRGEGIEESPPGPPLIMLHPGARYWFKAWPAERYAELADRLVESLGCRVLVGGDGGDREIAQTIRARARSSPAVLAGRTSLLQLAAILKRCVLFVGNDNGPMHIAAAMGTPVVALFGPSDPKVWGPCGDRIVALYKGLDCHQCFHPTCRRGEENCMKQIAVEEVFAEAIRISGLVRDA